MGCYSVAAQLYQENRREYEKRVAAIVEQSWQSYSTEEGDPAGGSASEADGSSSEQVIGSLSITFASFLSHFIPNLAWII